MKGVEGGVLEFGGGGEGLVGVGEVQDHGGFGAVRYGWRVGLVAPDEDRVVRVCGLGMARSWTVSIDWIPQQNERLLTYPHPSSKTNPHADTSAIQH